MTLIRKTELRSMNIQLLNEKIEELNKELTKLNAQRAVGSQMENPGKIRLLRRTIAQINTIINQKTEQEESKKI